MISPPRSLARATPSAPPVAPPKRNWFLGAPTRLVYERLVDGEVPDADFPLMVDEIRRVLQNVGQVSQLGRSFAWTMSRTGVGNRSVEVVVTVRGGCTRLTVQEPLGPLIGGIFGGIGGGMGGGGLGPILGLTLDALHLGPGAVAVMVPLWLAVTFATARTAYYYSLRRRDRTLADLADRLETLARQLAIPVPQLRSDPARAALPPG